MRRFLLLGWVGAFAAACGGGGPRTEGPDVPGTLDVRYGDTVLTDKGVGDADAAAAHACADWHAPAAGASAYDGDCAGITICKTLNLPSQGCGCVKCDAATCLDFGCQGVDAGGDAGGDVGVEDPGPVEDPGIADPGPKDTGPKDYGPPPDEGPQPYEYCPAGQIQADAKGIGEACTDKCQCKTGMCYMEEYAKGRFFCTRECSSCDEGFVCLQVGGGGVNSPAYKYNLQISSLCMPLCNTAADCKAINPDLTYCTSAQSSAGQKGSTHWEGQYIATGATCQVWDLNPQ